MSAILGGVGWLHRQLIKPRQSERLADILVRVLPHEGRVLDVGCGTGGITRRIAERNPGIEVQGIDVLVQTNAETEVRQFDGKTIPFSDRTFDAVLLIDVLHHADNQAQLVAEALRVSRGPVIVKDHICNGLLSFLILAFMDWVGNSPLGVHSPRTYLSGKGWRQLFDEVGITEITATPVTGLYPFPFSVLFERGKQIMFHLSNQSSYASTFPGRLGRDEDR